MDPEGKASASRRIAFGTLARLAGEAVGKVASLAFFIVIARELGEEVFGDFIFSMAFSTVFLIVAGLGLQELVGREIAKDPRRADDLVWNAISVRALTLVALLVVLSGVVAVQGRSLEIAAVILIVSLGIGFEDQAGTLYAVFNGRERQQYVAYTLIVNRVATALMGIGAAVAGAGAVTIAILFTAGSGLGLATAWWLMHRYVLRPRVSIQPRAWRTLLRTSAPLSVPGILGTLLFRTSVVVLGLVAAGSAAVGEFGAAYRLIEAAIFVPAAFNAAALAWFSREAEIARGFEMAIKTVLTLVLPIGLGLALFAEPLIEALYGADYGGAVTPLRLLGAVAVLWGVNTHRRDRARQPWAPGRLHASRAHRAGAERGPGFRPHPRKRGGRRRDRRPGRRGGPRDAGPAAHRAAGGRRRLRPRPGCAARGRRGDGARRGRALRPPVGRCRDRLRGGLRRRIPGHREGVVARRLRVLRLGGEALGRDTTPRRRVQPVSRLSFRTARCAVDVAAGDDAPRR